MEAARRFRPHSLDHLIRPLRRRGEEAARQATEEYPPVHH